MPTLHRVLPLLATGLVGLFAGAMLTEGFVLVPYWQSLEAGDFFTWYAANDERLLGFFGPLTAAAGVAVLVATVDAVRAREPGFGWLAVACTLTLASVATFFVYFEAANASFSAASVPPDQLPAELARWAAWHHARTAMSLVATAAMLVALGRRSQHDGRA